MFRYLLAHASKGHCRFRRRHGLFLYVVSAIALGFVNFLPGVVCVVAVALFPRDGIYAILLFDTVVPA